MAEDTPYSRACGELGVALRDLRRQAGMPSMDRIIKWGARAMPGTSVMAKGPVSEVLAGKRAPQTIDRLLWLVRALMAFEDGHEVDPPSRRDPALDPWRERWNTLQDARQAQRTPTSSSSSPPRDHLSPSGSLAQRPHRQDREPPVLKALRSSVEPDLPLAMRVLLARRNQNPIYLATTHCDDLIVAISFSTVDDLLVIALSDGDVLGCDVEKLEIVQRFNLNPQKRRSGNVTHFTFSENGRRFACTRMADPLTTWCRDEQSNEYQVSLTLGSPLSVAGRPPREELLSISDNGTVISGAASSGIRLALPGDNADMYVPADLSVTERRRDKLTALTISSDAQMVAWAKGDRVSVASVRDINVNPSAFTPTFEAPCRTGQVNSLQFNQGGKILACAGWEGVEILDFSDPNRPKHAVLGEANTHSVAFSLNGNLACVDRSGVSVFSLSDRRLVYRKKIGDVASVAFSLDSSILAVARPREVEFWS
ncbi:anaphase-promoting complex subunit 4 [Streptomyces sp. T12]|nr:anaphase-promoting complex subunit 4 [Streptomyces sp. T12]